MFSIDWIAYTLTGEGARFVRETARHDEYGALDRYDLVAEAAPWYSIDSWIREDKGLFGYNRCMVSSRGVRVMWHTERADMGIHVVIPGSALHELDTIGILCYVVSIDGTLTRLDICYDDTSDDITTVVEYVERYTRGDFVGRRRKYSEIRSDNGGHTFYIGARQSDRFMRIYNKAAEQGQAGSWVRVELELKGDAAAGAAKWLSFYGDEILKSGWDLSGVINSFVEFPGTTAWRNMRRAPMSFVGSDKGQRKTKQWALGAAKTQARLLALDASFQYSLEKAFRENGVVIKVELIEGD